MKCIKSRLLVATLGVPLILTGLDTFALQGTIPVSSELVSATLGGATVAQFGNEFGAVIDNPALLNMTKTPVGTQKFSFEFETVYQPSSVKLSPLYSDYSENKVKNFYVPFLGYFYNFSERLKLATFVSYIGVSSDYSATPYKAKASYLVVGLPLTASYKVSDDFVLGVSIAPQYSSVSSNNSGTKDTTASSISVTPAIGATYAATKSLYFGAYWVLGAEDKFKKIIYDKTTNTSYDPKVGIPMQVSLGVGQNTEDYSIGFRYRWIDWKNAQTYKQLAWKNQHNFSLGGQYKLAESWKLRAGIYYVTSVYNETSGTNGDDPVTLSGGLVVTKFARDVANAIQYETPLWLYGLGAGYEISAKSNIDFGVFYQPSTTVSFSGKTAALPGGSYEISTKQVSVAPYIGYTHTF